MRLDHVHLPCRDRAAMVAWLATVLDLAPDAQFAAWNVGGGPLFLSGPLGPALALFEADWNAETAEDHTIGFRLEADEFAVFCDHAVALGLTDRFGTPVADKGPTNHMDLAHSIYFVSPEGHRFEVTTYPETVS